MSGTSSDSPLPSRRHGGNEATRARRLRLSEVAPPVIRAVQLVLAALVFSLLPPGALLRRGPQLPARTTTATRYGKLPMRFEKNEGQHDPQVRFVARGGGATLFLTAIGATLSLRAPQREPASPEPRTTRMDLGEQDEPAEPGAVLRMKVAGGRTVAPRAEQKLVTISNYFIGNDPSKWRTDVPNFGRVVYPGVLPGVDLVYHGEEGQLEYDFIVAPGADSGKIALEVSGAKELSLSSAGDLEIHTEQGVLLQPRPRVYQRGASGETQEVAAGYRLMGESSVGFVVASYDRGRELVIDPVLQYSTYLGGARTDIGTGIAVDVAGSAYVTGKTESLNFPTQNPFQAVKGGLPNPTLYNAFVTKLSPAGDAIVYSTYLGGYESDEGHGIAVDGAGNAYVTGQARSTDFPMQNPFQAAYDGNYSGFVAKLSPPGALVYSTYLGGRSNDYGHGIAVDRAGSAYVTGDTRSSDFPMQNPMLTYADVGRTASMFVTKFSPLGNTLEYSTFIGGTVLGHSRGIAVDGAGSAYVTGDVQSAGFLMQNSFQAAFGGGSGDVFVAKLSPPGNALVYSTHLGGIGEEISGGIAVDGAGSAYVSGYTNSPNFPTQNPFQVTQAAGDAFVVKLSPAGNTLVYSTYLGGSTYDRSYGIAVDMAGSAYITGQTDSVDFPMQDPFQAVKGGSDDVFVAKLSPSGNALVYSSYFGGISTDDSRGIAVDMAGSAYITGYTGSPNLSTPGSFQPVNAAAHEVFVAKLMVHGAPTDAGVDASDAGVADASDSGAGDSGPSVDSGVGPSGPALDGSGSDASPEGGSTEAGCGCRTSGAPAGSGAAALALLAVAALKARRRGPGRAAERRLDPAA